MPPGRDQGQQGGDSPDMLAHLMEKLDALKANNEEVKASNEEIRARMTAIESRSTPQSVSASSIS